MRIYNYFEAKEDLSVVLDSALAEEVVIKSKDGLNYRLSPMNEIHMPKSPLEGIIGIKANVTTRELVDIIREGRAGV